jgi:cell division septum initiation protein DivIVA
LPDVGVKFSEQPMGYDKQQVDSYISKLTYEYQSMHTEYMNLVAKCNNLSETCMRLTEEKNHAVEMLQKPQSQGNNGKDAEAIGRAFIDAEIFGKQIVDKANAEAEKVKETVRQAREELKQVQLWKDKALIEVHEMRKKINSFFPE